jgi:hypothetical protein
MAADKEGRGNGPEAQQRCGEDDFSFRTPYAAI